MKKVLITGGSSGIGEGLARALHKKGIKVIIAGRNIGSLARIASECPGMAYHTVDVTDPMSIASLAKFITEAHPDLDTLFNNAGIQRIISFKEDHQPTSKQISEEIDTNLTGLIQVSSAFIPVLKKQPRAKIIHVSSGLALIPLVRAPIYSATKSAVRAFTTALREQLRDSSIKVIELIPPLVKTNLHQGQGATPPHAMELDQFIEETMLALSTDKDELPIGRAKILRLASRFAPKRFLKILNQLP